MNTNSPSFPDGTQAIITSYKFSCHGNISAWHAYLHQTSDGTNSKHYTIQFQVWRPSSAVAVDGCYGLVGENSFEDITATSDGLVSQTPEPSSIIGVSPGDVIGYYMFALGNNDADSGK